MNEKTKITIYQNNIALDYVGNQAYGQEKENLNKAIASISKGHNAVFICIMGR